MHSCRAAPPRVAIGASGSLLARIRRLLGAEAGPSRRWTAALAGTLVLAAILAAVVGYGCGEQETGPAETEPRKTDNPDATASPDEAPPSVEGPEDRELEARTALARGERRVRPGDAVARQRFLAIERFARLPAEEQTRQMPHFYRELAPRYMGSSIEVSLSSRPTDILDRDPAKGFAGSAAIWAEQLAGAADKLTPEEVADKLGGRLWLNVAARARAIQALKAHPKETASLIRADLATRQKVLVERAGAVIVALQLRTFTKQMLEMFLAEDDLSEPAGRALLWVRDDSVRDALLARVKKDPGFLARCAGHLQRYLWREPADPILLKLLEADDAEVRYNAARAVYECTDSKLAGPAARFAGEEAPRFRVQAAYLASNLPAEAFSAARTDLMALLNDSDEGVRLQALRCFARQEDRAAGPVILEYLQDSSDGPAAQREVTVMQALHALTGQHFGYDMHTWGPDTPRNARAIAKFEAWLAERLPAPTTRPAEAP